MAKIFIPTDRIGLESFQKSISSVTGIINDMLNTGIPIYWHTKKVRIESGEKFPEGHTYQCGYSVEYTDDVRDFLTENNILFETAENLPSPHMEIKHNRIAVYDGRGAGREFSDPLVEVLNMGGFSHKYLSDEDIRLGKLSEYDTLLVPGSPDAGECYYNGLGDLGFDKIREFIFAGGNYFGICGGAYLPLTPKSDKNNCWLNIVDATESEDLDYWHTGSGFVRCRITADEHPIFTGIATGGTTSLNLVYWEGPCMTITGKNVKPLAHFESLIASGSGDKKAYWDMYDNTMAAEAVNSWYNPLSQDCFDRLVLNKTAFAEAEIDGSKILLFSPHPEMGNIGYGPRKDSINFQLIFNGLFYLAAK